jgi:hypothetical protein
MEHLSMDTETATSGHPTRTEAPNATHRDTICISPVYHVGDLDDERTKPYTSHEGRGVSISVHPAAWEQIIRADGTSTHETLKTYKLTNPEAEIYYIDPSEPLTVEHEWCIEHEFVKETSGFRVTYEDEVSGTAYMEFVAEETAQMEADARDGTVEETDVLTLAPAGVKYWLDAFRQTPEEADPVLIAGLTPVWYAKANGYDGVWWDEEYDPKNYSAPRGVIFQSELESWEQTVEQQTSPF